MAGRPVSTNDAGGPDVTEQQPLSQRIAAVFRAAGRPAASGISIIL
jgi:hypothetical protein